MHKNLNPDALLINGRQSELIELTLTHGFRGFDLDIVQFQRQVEQHGLEHASRFFKSAPVHIGPFDIPLDWLSDEATFRADLEANRSTFETAQHLGSTACRVVIPPADATRPYHANFEFVRGRITELAEALKPYAIRLSLAFVAPIKLRETLPHPFISSPDAVMTLLKTCDSENVGMVVDLWHWHVAGASADALRELKPEQITEVRLADLAEGANLDEVTDADRLMPGETGVINAVSFYTVLSELGYEGPVTPCPDPEQFEGQKREEIVRTASERAERFIQNGGDMSQPDGDRRSDSLATADA